MIKRAMTLFFIACAACAQFPYHTNTGTFNATTNATGNYDAFSWNWMGYDDQVISVTLLPSGSTAVAFRMCYPRRGTVFVDETGGTLTGGTNFTLSIARTNLPPNGIYFAEFLGYVGAVTTMPARVLATGQINVQQSLFQNTSQSTWTNPLAGTVIGPPYHTLSDLTLWPFISTNLLDPVTLAMQDGLLTVLPGASTEDAAARAAIATHTGRVDNPHAVTAAQVGADAIGTASAVSNWASGRFSTLTGTVDYLADVAGLSNAVWETLGDYVPKSATNGWEVSPHLAWLTEETLWNAASNTVVYTHTPAYTDTVAKASGDLQSVATRGNVLTGTRTVGTMTEMILNRHTSGGIPAIGFSTGNATNYLAYESGYFKRHNPASGISYGLVDSSLLGSGGGIDVDLLDGNHATAFDPAGSAAAVSNAAWAQGWITAASIPAASNYATAAQGIKADAAYPASNPSNFLSVLPSALTGTSYSLMYGDTNVLILSHASPGAGPNMSGTLFWNPSVGRYTEDPEADHEAEGSADWAVLDYGTSARWVKSSSTPTTPIGVYSAVDAPAEGTVTVTHPITQTNAVITGAGGRMLSIEYINGTPAATILAGAARGAMALTNLTADAIVAGGGLTNIIVNSVTGTVSAGVASVTIESGGGAGGWVGTATNALFLGPWPLIMTGGGKTNSLTFDGTNFISTITP